MTLETSESIWAVSDSRAGVRNQALGLAEAVVRLSPRPLEIKTVDFKLPWRALPLPLLFALQARPPFALATPGSAAFAPPWPRLLIGCGRASLIVSRALKRASEGATFTVQTQDPRLPLSLFDLIVPPLHDGLSGANVFSILGSPNRITGERLAEARAKFAAHFESLPRPRVGILIGGSTRHEKLTQAALGAIADKLVSLAESGAGLMITTSRRTGARGTKLLAERLAGRPNVSLWTGAGENPYFGILAHAEFLLVTEDSVNMAAEAAATGKPVYTLKLEGRNRKHDAFHQELQRRGAERVFTGELQAFSYTPLREADRAAAEICKRANLPTLGSA